MDRILRSILEETDAGRAYLARLDAAKKAKRARHAPSRKARAVKRADHRSKTGLLRIAVFNRAGGRCAACTGLLGEEWHAHHVQGGGLRRSRQCVENVAPLCPECHRYVHSGDNLQVLLFLRGWAEEYANEETGAELEHRIAKVREARAARRTA